MWAMQDMDGGARLLAAVVYAAAVVAFLLVQEVGLRLRREEHRAWWAGTGRDLLNAAGLVAIGGALRLFGLSWPAALLVGGSLTLLMFGASVLFATQLRTAHPRAWSFATGAALALPVVLFPRALLAALSAIAGALFPGS